MALFAKFSIAVLVFSLVGCSSNSSEVSQRNIDADQTLVSQVSADTNDGLYPDVLEAEAKNENNTWTFTVTLSSPYDTPERYADAWRVRDADGNQYGIRELAHDHATEQPFTRSQSGIEIPATVKTVIIEGRDQVNGWGGQTIEIELK